MTDEQVIGISKALKDLGYSQGDRHVILKAISPFLSRQPSHGKVEAVAREYGKKEGLFNEGRWCCEDCHEDSLTLVKSIANLLSPTPELTLNVDEGAYADFEE